MATRSRGYVSLLLAGGALAGALAIRELGPFGPIVGTVPGSLVATRALLAAAVLLAVYGVYAIVGRALTSRAESKRGAHRVRSVLRLGFGVVALVGVLGVVTEQYVGLLFSLGIIGFAITFALQQPLLSLLGWAYIMLKQPYQVGDRVRIEDAKGDVIDVDFLVTTLWEVNGELVSTHQPSGRLVTVPNSVVLSQGIYNYSWEEFPFVWNELALQVAYETDLGFARETMRAVVDDYLGDEMEDRIERYRRVLGRTPVELEVRDRPTVNVRQEESWVELRVRYLVHPKQGQRVRNELYERILDRFNDEPERVMFPVGRNR